MSEYGRDVMGHLALFEDDAFDFFVDEGVDVETARRWAEQIGRRAKDHVSGVLV